MKQILLILMALWLTCGMALSQPQDDVGSSDEKKGLIANDNDSTKEGLSGTTIIQSVENKVCIDPWKDELQKIERINFILIIGLLVLLVLLFVLAALFFIDKRNRRGEIISTITDENNYGMLNGEKRRLQLWRDNFLREVKQSQPNVQSLIFSNSKKVDSILKYVEDMKRRIRDLEDINHQDTKSEYESCPSNNQTNIHRQTLFADAIVGDRFNKVVSKSNEETIYELLLTPSGITAEFTIFSKNKKQVLRNPDKIDGCEKQRINTTPDDIEIEKGFAELKDEKWIIKSKAKIKFV